MPAKIKSSKRSGKNFFLVSLGCPKNLVDTEVIAGTLLTAGRNLVFDPDEADVYIINTCAFIPSARKEATEAIQEGVAWKKAKPSRILIVAGCLPEWDKSGSYSQRFPEVDLWTGVNQASKLAELLDKPITDQPLCGKPSYLYDDLTPRLQLTLPHVAYLKIADGCDNCCSYCAIPQIRGRMRSRPLDSVLREAKNLVDGGVKELILIAQDITAYGNDRPESGDTLAKLLEQLEQLEGDFGIRLLYTHPARYTPELIECLSGKSSRVIPYLDIPLQHISDRILKQMNRGQTHRAQIEALLTKLRQCIPNLTLRTTFITGFPGETEEEFQELMQFAKKFKFERCGVFPYSPEPCTPAADFPNQVPSEIAEQRSTMLMRQQFKIMQKHNQKQLGKCLQVLVDEITEDEAIARGPMNAPEIDNVIHITNPKGLKLGQSCWIKIMSTTPDGDLIAKKIRKSEVDLIAKHTQEDLTVSKTRTHKGMKTI